MPARSWLAAVLIVFCGPHPFRRAPSKGKKSAIWRLALCGLLAASFSLLVLTPCRGQITNITDVTSTPIPGAGHNYIHLLTETVNPANGSLSVRIKLPVPKSRGITIPFSIAYDSNGVAFPLGTAGTWGHGDYGYRFQRGGWMYTVPYLDAQEGATYDINGISQCTYWYDYMFTDPSGERHALYLSNYDSSSGNCTDYPPPDGTSLTGGDDRYQAQTGLYVGGTAEVADWDGTTYTLFAGGGGYAKIKIRY